LSVNVVGGVGVDWAVFLVDFLIHFGLLLVVALGMNWVWGWAGLPFLGSSVPVLVGGFTVSAVTSRLIYFLASAAGVGLLPWGGEGWMYNSEFNAGLAEQWLGGRPLLGVALILLSLVLSFLLGGAAGWLIARPGLGRGPVYVGIASYALSNLAALLGREVTWFMGGTMGVFVPDLLAFAGEAMTYFLLVLVLFISGLVYLSFRWAKSSPFGRTIIAIRDNPVTASSLGLSIVAVRGWALFLGSGAMGVAGCLYAIHNGFAVQANYGSVFWTMWPLLMVLVGGFTGDAGVALGALLVQGLRYLLILNRLIISEHLFFPLAYLESLELGALMIIFLLAFPRGLESIWTRLTGRYRAKLPTTSNTDGAG
jgi:branched-chain amino acid transport system permease protein